FQAEKGVAPVPKVMETPALVPKEEVQELRGAGLPSLTQRMIIRQAELSLVVKDTKEAIGQVESIAVEKGGYLHQSEVWKEGESLKARLVIMVPADKFEETLAALRDIATDVLSESVSGQDVTEEYVDLSARLKNLEATEEELRELLATVRERSGKAEDILAVYRELSQIRSEIERVKGRMKYLEQMTAFSTITVSITPSILAQPIAPATWQPARTFWKASRALVKAFQALVNVLIWVVVFGLPILIVVSIPFVLALWIWRRRRKVSPKA
ncbi:MAG TPA: DUF4349 domain-containing protein, partial [Chloroflexi bacterium]|nr:DUF4349 domain-containing protein [Chloroflexota bacterium]